MYLTIFFHTDRERERSEQGSSLSMQPSIRAGAQATRWDGGRCQGCGGGGGGGGDRIYMYIYVCIYVCMYIYTCIYI